jgi:hypothetical protein
MPTLLDRMALHLVVLMVLALSALRSQGTHHIREAEPTLVEVLSTRPLLASINTPLVVGARTARGAL